MNDDELGRALSTALAPPDVQPAADAGARIRERARRDRTRRWAAGGTVAVVLAVLAAVGVVRIGTDAGPAPVASGVSYGHSLLRTPIWVGLADGAPRSPEQACAPGQTCTRVQLLIIDEVAGLRISGPPADGAAVVLTLTADDDRTLSASTLPSQQSHLAVDAATFRYGATYRPGSLRIGLPAPEVANALVTALAPYRPMARTGPGRLDPPLRVWSVVAAEPAPCVFIPDIPHKLALNRLGECLVLDGPVVTLHTADVRLHPRAGAGSDWGVEIDPAGAGRSALLDWTTRHAGQRVAFGVGDRLVVPAPEIQGGLASLELITADRASAEALVNRLRP